MNFIISNETLNPDFWNAEKDLNPEIKEAFLNIAETFYKDIDITSPIEDIYILGSSANYNWTPTSDVDLHILMDFSKLDMPAEDARKYADVLAKKWNMDHDINIKGHKVEVYIQDIKEENRSTGVYSLKTDEWVKEATKEDIQLNRELIKEKYAVWANKINDVIKTQDSEKLKKVMKGLTNMRETGLSKSGEYSTENIVFKMLRQQQVIKKLKDSIQSIKSKELSLPEEQS